MGGGRQDAVVLSEGESALLHDTIAVSSFNAVSPASASASACCCLSVFASHRLSSCGLGADLAFRCALLPAVLTRAKC
eukprot:918036-Rhodomonas_salina.2